MESVNKQNCCFDNGVGVGAGAVRIDATEEGALR